MIPSSCRVLFVKDMALIEGPVLEIEALKFDLTIRNKFTLETISLWKPGPEPTQLLVPRGIVEQQACPGQWLPADIQFTGELREKQIPIVQCYLDHIKTHNGGIIKAKTGTGKTIMGMSIMATLGLKTLIIVPYSHLLQQWAEGSDGTGGILKFTNIKREEIGIAQGDKCDFEGKKVVMGMVHSLAKEGRYPEAFYREFGFVVYDECLHPSHELLTRMGWKNMPDITEEDTIAQVDGITQEITFVHPERLISRDFDGELVGFKNQHIDLLATPNHEHLVYWNKEETPNKISYQNLEPKNRWSHVVGGYAAGTKKTLSSWEKFLLAFQADGHHLYTNKAGTQFVVRFAFRKARKSNRLRSLLQDLPHLIKHRESFNCRGDNIFSIWLDELPTKYLNWISFNEDFGYYQSILEEIVLWDGWTQEKRGYYESDIKENAEIVQIVASLSGNLAKRNDYLRKGTKKIQHRTAWRNNLKREMRGVNKYSYHYVGKVFCVQVPAGNILTRRNGRIGVTGNCHRLSAETFSRTAGMFHCKYRLGLSATPRRADGTEKIFLSHIGEICTPDTQAEVIPSVVMAVYPGEDTSSDNCMSPDYTRGGRLTLDLGRYINKVARSVPRNRMLAGLIHKAYLKDRDILVLSERLNQLTALKALLLTLGVPFDDMGSFTGKSKEGLDRRILLATFGSAGTGADIPRLSCLVMATPRADVEQAVGRILRGASDDEPLVIDIVDEASSIMQGWAAKRRRFYQSITEKVTTWRAQT